MTASPSASETEMVLSLSRRSRLAVSKVASAAKIKEAVLAEIKLETWIVTTGVMVLKAMTETVPQLQVVEFEWRPAEQGGAQGRPTQVPVARSVIFSTPGPASIALWWVWFPSRATVARCSDCCRRGLRCVQSGSKGSRRLRLRC